VKSKGSPGNGAVAAAKRQVLDSEIGNYSTTIWLLGAAVGCLLLISSANVANLLFARALARRREIAIRAAMGASRLRLMTQLVLETLFLSLLGAVAGLLVAFGTIQAIKALAPQDQYRFQEISVDGMAMAFVFAVILLTSFLSGLLPAWSLSNTNLGSAVKEEGGRTGTGGPRRQRTRSGLVIALGLAALPACLLPGLRATRISPITALRD